MVAATTHKEVMEVEVEVATTCKEAVEAQSCPMSFPLKEEMEILEGFANVQMASTIL